MFMKNRKQVDPVRRRSRGVMQRGEQHVLFQAARISLNALQDACMKGMEKIAVAQEKADHFCASLENPAGLRIGAESQTPDSLKYSRTRFPAHLRAGIEHAGNRSYANGSGPCNLANRRFPWNCFHSNVPFLSLCPLTRVGEKTVGPFPRLSLAHQKRRYPQQTRRPACLQQELRKPIQSISFMNSDLTGGFHSVRVWNQFQASRCFSLYLA